MSDVKENLGKILKIEPVWSSNERRWKTVYSTLGPEEKKYAAASVVLELIKADVSAPTHRTGTRLDSHIHNLPEYINQVLSALENNE